MRQYAVLCFVDFKHCQEGLSPFVPLISALICFVCRMLVSTQYLKIHAMMHFFLMQSYFVEEVKIIQQDRLEESYF